MEHPVIKIAGESVSISVILGSLFGILPKLAALASICWYGVMFYDRFLLRKRQDKALPEKKKNSDET